MTLGIALTTKADLGTTPIASLPYVASLGLGASMGIFSFVMNMALVIMQVAVMRKKFPKIQYLQIPASVFFGLFIDFFMNMLPTASGGVYAHKLLFLAAGTVVLAFGVFMSVSANVVVMPGEGAVMVLSLISRRDFGIMKVIFDSTLVFTAIALSLVLFYDFKGVREGTLISAFTVGFIVRFFFGLQKKFATGR